MIKNLLALSFSLISIVAISQDNTGITNSLEDKNELKVNGLFLILGAIEVDYQYLINDESGIGIDVLLAFDDYNLDINYAVSPYYRQYFGKKRAAGFFVEGFGMLNSTDDYFYDETYDATTQTFSYNYGTDTVVDFALGIGTGVKLLTKRGFIVEIDLGIGRNLFKTDRDYTIIGKGGVHLGYRF